MLVIRSLTLAIVMLSAVAARAQTDGEDPFTVNGWLGDAYYSDATDEFMHCAIIAEYSEEIFLIYFWSNDGFFIDLLRPSWSLTSGTTHSVFLHVDDRWSGTVVGRVVSPMTIQIRTADDAAAVEALSFGERLYVTAADDWFYVNLDGTGAAIEALQDCYRRHGGGDDPRAADAGPSGADAAAGVTAAPASGQQHRSPPRLGFEVFEEFVRTHVSDAAIIVPAGGAAKTFSDYLFLDRDSIGLYWEEQVAGRSAAEVVDSIMADSQERCMGRPDPAVDREEQVRGITVHSGLLDCPAGEGFDSMGFVVVAHPDHMQVFLVAADPSPSGEASAVTGSALTMAVFRGMLAELKRL